MYACRAAESESKSESESAGVGSLDLSRSRSWNRQFFIDSDPASIIAFSLFLC